MDNRWLPRVHSAFKVEIPVVVFQHSETVHQRWKAQKPWKKSGYANYSATIRLLDAGTQTSSRGNNLEAAGTGSVTA